MIKIARVKFIRDKEPNIKALTAKNKVLDGTLYVATDTGTLWMGISSSSLIQIKDNINTNTTYNLTKSGSTITLRGSDGSTFNVTDSNTVYGNATASAAGLMSAADKAKLDGVAAGSNHIVVDSELSTISTNPVQNKVIKSAFDGKSNTGHKHVKADITDFPTSMPASDVSAWAKAATKPSYSKAEVGLGSVDNTADSAKSVKYAASAGSASSATTAATANALKVTELTTQNLDDTKTVGLYFADGTNSVKNKPTGVNAFGLEVKKTATGYLVQVLTDGNINPMKTWIRQFNASAWSAWAHYFDSNHAPTWSQVSGKPSFATVATSGSYNDLSNKPTIPTIPGSLKNPNALTISLNGTSQGAYDGSAVKNINITASSVGAAAASHSHNYAGADSAGGAANAVKNYGSATANALRPIWFSDISNDTHRVHNDNFKYNPEGNIVTCNVSGTANFANYLKGTARYVTQDSAAKPYWRCLKLESKTSWLDSSVVLCVDSGYENGGFGILAVRFRNDKVSESATATHGNVQWLCRYGYEPDQFILKIYSAKSTVGYADLYFHATGTYNACNIRILANSIRGGNGSSWQLMNDEPRAAMDTRQYTSQATGYDVGKVAYASSAGSANSVSWGNVSGKPSTYAPSLHIHDDRYYTVSEMNTKLNAKAESDVVTISSTKPTSNTCKLWIKI